MSLANWFQLVVYFAFTAGVGHMVIACFRFGKNDLLKNWAAYFLAGQIVLTILTLFTGFFPVRITHLRCVLLAVLAVYWVHGIVRRAFLSGALRTVISVVGFGCLAMVLFPSVLFLAQDVPLWEWDARSNWFFPGKAIYMQGWVDAAFFTNPAYCWGVNDYPILIPVQAAWTALFNGAWSDYSNKSFLLLNFTAYFYLLHAVFKRRGCPWWLSVCLTTVLLDQETYSYLSGYADNHYTIAIFIAILLPLLDGGLPGQLPLFILLLSFAACIKNEATVYVLLLGVAVAIGAAVAWAKRPDRRGAVAVLSGHAGEIAWALLMGVCPVLLWAVFKAVNCVSSGLDMFSRSTDTSVYAELLPERAGVILRFFADFYCSRTAPFVVGLLALLIIFRLVRRRQPAARCGPESLIRTGSLCSCASLGRMHWCEWLIAGGLIFVHVFLFLVYTVSPFDVQLYITTAGTRTLFFPFMGLAALCLYSLDRIAGCA